MSRRRALGGPLQTARARRVQLGVLIALGAAVACGTSGGGQLASSAAQVLVDGIARGPRDEPPNFSARRGRCFLFEEHGVACPVLPRCDALSRLQEPVQVNACDDGSQRIRPITTCKGWQGEEHLCPTRAFPACNTVMGAACGGLEWMVCEKHERQRLARCCAAGAACPDETYVLVPLRERAPDAGSGGAPTEADAPHADGPHGDVDGGRDDASSAP